MTQLSIKNLRHQAGRTQKETAELLDVDTRTYRKWENDPTEMPHGAYLQLIDFLERSVQIRKEIKMGTDMGKASVVFDQSDDKTEYTVPVPEGLSEEFEPSRPVSRKQWMAYDATGVEPYPGFTEELQEWEKAWEAVNSAQLEADGAPPLVLDTVQVDPEFDEETGEPITYDEVHVNVDASNGSMSMDIPEADITDEEREKLGE